MHPPDLFPDVVWFRLAIVAIDILAVITIVRLWAAVGAWWRGQLVRRPVPARVRATRTGPRRA